MPTLQTAFLCTSALGHESGTFSLLGGGIRTWAVAEFPAVVGVTFFAQVVWSEAEAAEDHSLRTMLIHPDGELLARTDLRAPAPPWVAGGLEPLSNLFLGMTFEVRRAARYAATLEVDGHALITLPLLVDHESALPR